jgi:hypothetical protein
MDAESDVVVGGYDVKQMFPWADSTTTDFNIDDKMDKRLMMRIGKRQRAVRELVQRCQTHKMPMPASLWVLVMDVTADFNQGVSSKRTFETMCHAARQDIRTLAGDISD